MNSLDRQSRYAWALIITRPVHKVVVMEIFWDKKSNYRK